MKNLSFLFCLFPLFLTAQSLKFNRTYGGARYDDARSIVTCNDGNLLFTGLCKSAADSMGDMYLTKVNAAGAVLWTQYYGRTAEDGGNHVLPCADGGYLITGHTAFSYGADCDAYFVKTDADGHELWRSFLGTSWDDVASQSIEMPDGSFVTVGKTEDETTHSFRILLGRISANGLKIMQKGLETAMPDIGATMAIAADGNLLLAGFTYDPAQEKKDQMLVVKCTFDGTILWRKQWPNALDERVYSIQPNADGGCFIVGGTADEADQFVHMSAYRLDAQVNMMAAATELAELGKGYLYAATALSNGNLVVAGMLQKRGAAYCQPFVAELDPDLKIVNSQTAELSRACRTRALTQTATGDFVLCGNLVDVPQGDYGDIFLSKVNFKTSAVKDLAEETFVLFPNPFVTQTYIKAGKPGRPKTLRIYSPEGREMSVKHFDGDEYILERGNLQQGSYFFDIEEDNSGNIKSGMLMIQDK
ncbi:MAG: T9SS type A sorting domain-containing protein [Bacteroidota bacterium]